MRRPVLLFLFLFLLATFSAGGRVDAARNEYYFGADLSYINELEDCGAVYTQRGKRRDPFQLFREQGANLVRVRLWNDPQWTRYSNLADVKKTIARSRKAGMQVLLNFHYSDDWADGEKQLIPKAWEGIADVDALAAKVYEFTFDTLMALHAEGLMPELVQVGNETNKEILSSWEKAKRPIDWSRNAKLLNAGIRGVRAAEAKAAADIRVMLHIAQPENVEPWFAAATQAGVTDFDLIGISYYRRWSTETPQGLYAVIDRLRHRYDADVLVVEAAYPWTLDAADQMPNLLGKETLIEGYPATKEGQREYLIDLTQQIMEHGGVGLVYWEPAWISTSCKTRWGTGSAWENAALFDFDGELLPGAGYLGFPYRYPIELEFRLDDAAFEIAPELYFWGDFLGESVPAIRFHDGGRRSFETKLVPGRVLRLQLYASSDRKRPLLRGPQLDEQGLLVLTVGKQDAVIDLTPFLRDR